MTRTRFSAPATRHAFAIATAAVGTFSLLQCSANNGTPADGASGGGGTVDGGGGTGDGAASVAPGPTCGSAQCAPTQFCAAASCQEDSLANLCANNVVTVVSDVYQPDNMAGSAIGAALGTSCNPTVTVNQTSQTQSGVLDSDGRPLTGNTLVVGGGSYGQQAVAYMDGAGLTPLFVKTDGVTAQFVDRVRSTAVVETQVSALTAHHDYFLLELSTEPQSDTLCFFAVGMYAPGTTAAAYFASSQAVPQLSTMSHTWYVYEWTDANNDSIPNAGDTFNQIAGGP
jgi:hypothetical protein